ncbi:aminotransferase-like domain-containing protein [Rhizobium sp. C4]|uniref:aminotransferase-like domain-containing protein n=1 Tax=Rhizobium sp. C4 TaxID=1349800 RepID=UPI001E4C915B|nr:PLP-dependent aminotransferase family protein [Rhizobium sp. C4]MCD2172593.1 PLP-dependent aminotransferase family protein [Rhizobium sp. C4]
MASGQCEKVMTLIRERISARALLPGEKLPSVRSLAASTGISKSTVVEAYDRLTASGLIEPRRGAGFYVGNQPVPHSLKTATRPAERAIDPLWMSRQALEPRPGMVSPGCGWLPESWMPQEIIARALRTLARNGGAQLTDYSEPKGFAPLRQLLARRLATRDIKAGAEEVVLADSASAALDLVLRFLTEPGDTILVDDPCYFNFLAGLRANRLRVVSVPFGAGGPDVAAFAHLAETERPRLYLTNAGVQNPTGWKLSPVTAHKVLKLAERHDLLIVEDDIFGDLEGEPAPRYAAMDGLERVIVIGSFSKTLSAAFRTGYVAMRPDWVEDFTDFRIASRFGGNQMTEALVHAVLSDSAYRRHLDGLRNRLVASGDAVGRQLEALGFERVNPTLGGFFLWCRLPDGLGAVALSKAALEHGLVLAPGNVFSHSGNASDMMRFNVAQCDNAQVFTLLQSTLGEIRKK